MSRNPFAPQPDDWKEPKPVTPPGSGDTPAKNIQVERSHITGIPSADWRPRQPKKDTRKREKSRWLSFLTQNKQCIEKHANALNVPEYELVRYLLEYGLDQTANGQLILEPQLSQEGLTLYPNERRGARKSRKGRADLVNATYRSIPDETWEALKTLARDYPIWQVANRLIEHGLVHLESGDLNPKPQSSGIQTLY